jgi:hypothetical protein
VLVCVCFKSAFETASVWMQHGDSGREVKAKQIWFQVPTETCGVEGLVEVWR